MKKICAVLLAMALAVMTVGGCSAKPKYEKYESTFFDTFDTIIQFTAYASSQEEFDKYAQRVHSRFVELHQLCNRFESYDGVNNVKTISDNAGVAPVKVDPQLIELVEFAIPWADKTGDVVNPAIGPVLSIWHDYMARYQGKEDGSLPPMEELYAAAQHTDLTKVKVDKAASTIYLEEEGMALDFGAVAKGWATEKIAQELETSGFNSFIISSGGNVRASGPPMDSDRTSWGVGIQNPDGIVLSNDNSQLLETLFLNNSSVVTSGDYQRYYVAEGKRVHHIVDPQTLMPANRYRSVTIVTPDSGMADMLSTAVFIMDYNTGKALVDSVGAQAMWVYPDGTVKVTDGLKPMMLSEGATNRK